MNRRLSVLLSAFALSALAGSASAAVYNLTWLDMSPTTFGNPVPNASVFFLPGAGNVTVTYSIPSTFLHGRFNNPVLTTGSVVSGGDTYQWTNHEMFAATLQTGPDPLVPVPWRITYTFQNPMAAGSVYVGVAGLGQTTSFGGGASVATVNQNGTFLGDWPNPGTYGPTQYTGGPGTFSMQNSLTGPGGADPWWNTPLGVVRIDDAISSLTVDFMHIRGDGVGVNIAVVPTPGAFGLLGVGALLAARRRR